MVFTDTHCHINMMVKKDFDVPLTEANLSAAHSIVDKAKENNVTTIINVGTSLIESKNCIELARRFAEIYASIGIHPNDATDTWKEDLKVFESYLKDKEELKIVAIGECGMDKHYPDYNLERQKAVFKAQIELALRHNLALVIHSRDAYDETLGCLEEYKRQGLRGTIHCFSEDLAFAKQTLEWGFVLGIGGTITYPKNNIVRAVVRAVGIDKIILETDAPFLPPQIIRGKQNHPMYIKAIAEYVAQMVEVPLQKVSEITENNVKRIFFVPTK